MGLFSCFESRSQQKTNHSHKQSDHRKDVHPYVQSNMSKLSSGGDRAKLRNTVGSKKESPSAKDGPFGNIAAHTFTFRELAAATKNFRPESFLGEGGFGSVYKG